MWVITALVVLVVVINVLERNWASAVTFLVISVVGVFINRRAIRKLRERQS